MQWIRSIHKWTSLVVGVQFMLWLGSGFYFNLMDHHKVGGHTYRAHAHDQVQIDSSALVEPRSVLEKAEPSVSLKQIALLGQPYYLLTHKRGLYPYFENEYSLFDAYRGNEVSIDAAFATRLAKQSYNGPGSVGEVTLLQPPLEDFPKQKNAAWRVNFNDDIQTSVYIEAGSGRVVGHSDAHKRFADIFFMLHFMDYGNEGSFNNIQIILFAFVTLWLSLSGLIWTLDLIRRGQYKVALLSKRTSVKIFDHEQQLLDQLELSTATNLLDGLAGHDISLPSTCGGGGTCGRCKVLINPAPKATSADQQHFSQAELAQGFRLACQHFSDDVQDMTLFDVTDAKKVELTLVGSEFVTPDIKELRFKVQGPPLAYKAGAFMRFFIPEGQVPARPHYIPSDYKAYWDEEDNSEYPRAACSRNYSLTSVSQLDEELVFAIKYHRAPQQGVPAGSGSSYLCNMAPGDTVDALGPFEEFYVDQDPKAPIVVIGSGSGMAPLRGIIKELLLANNSKQEIHFYFGARHEEDLLYQEEFFALSQRFDNFRYTPVLSQAGPDWLGATGYAQQVLFNNMNKEALLAAYYYMCGPKAMMDETIATLVNMGVDKNVIHFDSFS
ncbi:2Fe-2S iron-sulfur cluster-binding protein [Pseudoalteromonas sp. T1lg76]|uniref:2Fe-2S iron-sulfur cluster-binding protein n=1 Tax=Pseudoalteromonas sp. T1lg76 TaxID=2077103 RepID=UPI000CF6B708|nr:2Fe-2S iron-sulfur cluster-binding protein [Pseudoalteromonas sp. T1lg76]